MLFFFIAIDILSAQSKGTLNYKLTTRTRFERNELNHIIYFHNGQSIELGIPKKQTNKTEKISESEINETRVLVSNKKLFVYKNFLSKKLLLSDYIMAKKVLITDTLNNLKWKISTEHRKVLNYTCTKATVNFRGRNYTAWFTEQIPLPLGPWKFGDLPGLIIKVTDNEGKFDYELTGINLRAKFDDKIIAIPLAYAKDKAITHQQFISLLNKKIADNEKLSRVVITLPDGEWGKATINLPEKKEKF